MHPIVALAKKTITEYVINKVTIVPPEDFPKEMKKKRAGVFVSLKKNGVLRGCIGTFSPVYENIALEIIENAINASTRDPRFLPVEAEELDSLDISVDLLSSPEKIKGRERLDPERYGIIVESGHKRGLLLPALEGVDTVEDQIAIVRNKAGIADHDEITLSRFEVIRYR